MRELAYKNKKKQKMSIYECMEGLYIYIEITVPWGLQFWLGDCKPIMFLLVYVIPIYILGLGSDAHISVLCTSDKLLVI